jgi:hypothetical protein
MSQVFPCCVALFVITAAIVTGGVFKFAAADFDKLVPFFSAGN